MRGHVRSATVARLTAASMAAAAALPIVQSKPAGAELDNCGTRSNYFDGYGFAGAPGDGRNAEGVRADLLIQFGAVCNSDHSQSNFSTAWVMVADGDFKGYSQAGFFRWYGSAIYPFAENSPSGGSFTRVIDMSRPQTIGSNKFAKTEYNNSSCVSHSQCFKNYFDGVLLQESSYNPLTTFNTTPWVAETFGETTYTASDQPGNPNAHTKFTNMYIQRYNDNQWSQSVPANAFALMDSSRWNKSGNTACNGAGTTCFDIWTR